MHRDPIHGCRHVTEFPARGGKLPCFLAQTLAKGVLASMLAFSSWSTFKLLLSVMFCPQFESRQAHQPFRSNRIFRGEMDKVPLIGPNAANGTGLTVSGPL